MSRTPLVIRNERELQRALDRAGELAGCTKGSENERELREITAAIKVYTESMRVLRMLDRNPNETGEFASDD